MTTESEAKRWPPDFLDLEGLAHTLCTSVRSVRRLLAAGRLPPADTNLSLTGGPKSRRWRRERLLAYLAGRRFEPQAHEGAGASAREKS